MASLVATVTHPPTIIWPMFWKSPPSVGQWGNSTKKEKKSYLSSRYTLVLSEPGKCLKDIFFFSGGDLVSSPESPVGNAPLLFLQCEQPHLHFGEWLHQESSGPSIEFCFLFFVFFWLRSHQPCKQPIAQEWRWPRPIPSSRAFICSVGHTQATLVLINSRKMGKCDSGHLFFSWSICCKLLSHPLDF